MSNSPFVISKIEEEDIPEIATLYALSFFDNKCYDSIFPDYSEEEKLRAFKWFFTKRLTIAKYLNWIMLKVKNSSTNMIVGSCCAVPPGADSTLMDNILHGILAWPCYWGFDSFFALLHLMKLTKSFGGWELAMMAIHPECQGKRIGHLLLKEILQTITERSQGKETIIHLSTQKELNLTFYEKAGGFTVLSEHQFTYYHRPETYPCWYMKLVINKPE